jgi:nicotinate dehydrogenase subunit A
VVTSGGVLGLTYPRAGGRLGHPIDGRHHERTIDRKGRDKITATETGTMAITLKVNGQTREVAADADTPLLYALRNDLKLNGAKFGCGLAQCGACTVNIDGAAVRSCVTPIGSLEGKSVTTLEGIGSLEKLHPLQKAFIAEQAAQCGYCTSGMIMSAKALLDGDRNASDADIRQAMAGNLCRCGSHPRIVRAIKRAAKEMA